MSKKNVSVFTIVVLLLVSVLSACSVNEDNNNNSSKGQNSQQTKQQGDQKSSSKDNSAEEPIEISVTYIGLPPTDDTLGEQWLEEKFNIKIKNIRLERDSWQQQLNVMLASKNIPDIFWLNNAQELRIYAQQGVLAEMPVEEIKTYLPEYASAIEEINSKFWKYSQMDGKNYAIPLVTQPLFDGPLPIYRGDWLEHAGYDRAPETLEELEEVLYSFRNDDPDGNGKKDTYGISAGSNYGGTNITAPFNTVFGAHQINVRAWNFDDNGKLVYGMVTEKARAAFKVLQKWFEDGIIDPEFITTERASIWDGIVNGRYGMADSENYHQHYKTGQFGRRFLEKGIEAVSGKPVSGPYGEGKGYASYPLREFIGMGVQVEQDEKKKEKIYELLNALSSDKETYIFTRHGQEGVHYEIEDGDIITKEEYVPFDKRKAEGLATYGFFFTKSPKFSGLDMEKEKRKFAEKLAEGVEPAYQEVMFSIPLASDYPDLPKLEDEYFLKFILSEVDLDQGFDDFVKLWNQSGGKAITDQVNQLYEKNYK